jgi:type II secretory pathway pseudopilin PulG
MIAVGIVILLATITYTNLGSSKKRSRDAIRQGDLKSLALAADRYFTEHFSLPDYISGGTDISKTLDPYFGTGALDSAPKDPLTKAPYAYKKSDPGSPKKYCFGATMEATSNSVACDSGDPANNYRIQGP